MASAGADAKVLTKGKPATTKHDKTKQPMEDAMWTKMRPIMHTLGDLADGYERFGNLLSPTRPFPQEKPRLVLATIFVPLIAVSLLTTPAIFYKISSGVVGLAFFTDPLIWRALDYLNTNYPNWQKYLELRNSILKGVPTNAQLTITLLRLAEANKAPLPPPPRSDQPAPNEPAAITDEHLKAVGGDPPLNATEEELKEAIKHDPSAATDTAGADVDAAKHQGHGSKASRMFKAFKGSVKGSIETTLGADHVKAKVGSEHSKRRLGVVPRSAANKLSGPVEFKCRYATL